MGSERSAEVKSTMDLGWRVPATATRLVVVGSDGGVTSRFVLTGSPEHRQLVRYDAAGQATTARPATREEDWLFIALQELHATNRELFADVQQAHRQIDMQEGLLNSLNDKYIQAVDQISNQAAEIELLRVRPTRNEHSELLAERDKLAAEVHELADSNDRLREGINALQKKLADAQAENARNLALEVERRAQQ